MRGGSINLNGSNLRVGNSGSGSFSVSNAVVNANEIDIGQENSSSGDMIVQEGADINSSWAVYVGKKGTGVLTVNGGSIKSAISVVLADADTGSGELNLNGGVITTAEIVATEPNGVFNWNGGALTRVSHMYVGGNDILPEKGLASSPLE